MSYFRTSEESSVEDDYTMDHVRGFLCYGNINKWEYPGEQIGLKKEMVYIYKSEEDKICILREYIWSINDLMESSDCVDKFERYVTSGTIDTETKTITIHPYIGVNMVEYKSDSRFSFTCPTSKRLFKEYTIKEDPSLQVDKDLVQSILDKYDLSKKEEFLEILKSK